LYGNGEDFGTKMLKNKICSEIYKIFDLSEAYVNVVDETD
jgi:hypothetical protein